MLVQFGCYKRVGRSFAICRRVPPTGCVPSESWDCPGTWSKVAAQSATQRAALDQHLTTREREEEINVPVDPKYMMMGKGQKMKAQKGGAVDDDRDELTKTMDMDL